MNKERKEREFIAKAITNDTEECIVWPYRMCNGYGVTTNNGTIINVSRLVCIAFNGEPMEGMQAAHGPCHNRACINGKHLSWKTRKENAQDKLRDGTATIGERNGKSKLTNDQASEIIALIRGKNLTHAEIGARYNIARSTVTNIGAGRRYGVR